MKSAPKRNDEPLQDSWAVWKAIAKGRPHFGRPDVFCGRIEKTAWESFSVTCRGKAYADLMTSFSNKIFGTEGMITLKGSPWLLSIVTPPQPHFVNQPDSITVFWGYGQFPDKKGEYVKKMMSECTGEEILIEVFSHLGLNKDLPRALASMNCIPCMMPYISSQFMPRRREDRPEVLPKGTRNFAFMGQYCEVPAEVVFTVEQSVRSAMIAVRGLTGSKKKVPPIYRSFPTLF